MKLQERNHEWKTARIAESDSDDYDSNLEGYAMGCSDGQDQEKFIASGGLKHYSKTFMNGYNDGFSGHNNVDKMKAIALPITTAITILLIPMINSANALTDTEQGNLQSLIAQILRKQAQLQQQPEPNMACNEQLLALNMDITSAMNGNN